MSLTIVAIRMVLKPYIFRSQELMTHWSKMDSATSLVNSLDLF